MRASGVRPEWLAANAEQRGGSLWVARSVNTFTGVTVTHSPHHGIESRLDLGEEEKKKIGAGPGEKKPIPRPLPPPLGSHDAGQKQGPGILDGRQEEGEIIKSVKTPLLPPRRLFLANLSTSSPHSLCIPDDQRTPLLFDLAFSAPQRRLGRNLKCTAPV